MGRFALLWVDFSFKLDVRIPPCFYKLEAISCTAGVMLITNSNDPT